MKNRWVDTSHGTKGDSIYGMFDSTVDSDIMKENLQEWLCDNHFEVTECISIALHNHERTYSEWFRYVDSCSGPNELALYCLSRKMGIHTAVFNKSYIWMTLADHITCTDKEIIQLCGVNLVFLVQPTTAFYVTFDGQVRTQFLTWFQNQHLLPTPPQFGIKRQPLMMDAHLTIKKDVAVVMVNLQNLQIKENDHTL